MTASTPAEQLLRGLSAFPLTPISDHNVDETAYAALVSRLAAARVDTITALGSTGSYAYLTRAERARVAALAVEHAGDIPVLVGIGGLRTEHVLEYAADAEAAGAAALLLAPMSYQALTADDVYGLFDDVTRAVSLPVIVYDNPGTTHFTFTEDLYASIARLPRIASIKIPAVPADLEQATERVRRLRAALPSHVTIGVSGDASAATGLAAGCDAWYSVIAGTLPAPAVAITRAAQEGRAREAAELSKTLDPLWELFAEYGSLRVTAAIAEHFGLVQRPCLPLPIRGLDDAARDRVARMLEALDLRL